MVSWKPCEWEPALQAAITSTITLENLNGETCLTQYLMWPDIYEGWEGLGAKLLKSATKAMIHKEQESKQIGSKMNKAAIHPKQ